MIKADWRAGAADAMTQKVASVERYLLAARPVSSLSLHCVPERLLGRVAVDREHHPLQRTRLVLPDGVDHQPRGVFEREAADAGTERHQRQRAATKFIGLSQGESVARAMISAEVGPPSSIVAAWIT